MFYYFTIMFPFYERKHSRKIKPRFNVNAKYRKRFCLRAVYHRYACFLDFKKARIIIKLFIFYKFFLLSNINEKKYNKRKSKNL